MGDTHARSITTALQQRDWRAANDLFRQVTDPDDHAFYTQVAADVDGLEATIDEWVALDPANPQPLLLKGARGVLWAWEARGGAGSADTSEQQFKEFFRRLKTAEDCLDEVTERDQGNATAWLFLLISARGRQVDRDEALRRFQGATARHPWHQRAHHQMLQYLCAKWFGSEEEMFGFAREAVAKSPQGSPLGTLIALAHIEKWLSDEGSEYFEQEAVRAELRAALDHSLRHPAYRPRAGWPVSENIFAFALSMADEHALAAERFQLIGDLVTETPWQYFRNDPAKGYAQLREYTLNGLSSGP